MNLIKVHQIMIITAIVGAVAFATRGFVLFFRGQGADLLLGAVLGAALAVGLGLYLRRFREKLRAAPAQEASEP